MTTKILIVDDELDLQELIRRKFPPRNSPWRIRL